MLKFDVILFFIIIYLENLLNSSKCQHLNDETPVTHPPIQSGYFQRDESIDDDRHERTGSVKFADQAEENKEVY